MQHYPQVSPHYLYVYSSQTDSQLAKMIATISGVSHPGISFENGSLIGEHYLLIYLSFVMVKLAFIKMKTHYEDMECNDRVRAVTSFISRYATLHNPYMQVVKMCRVRWVKKVECVCSHLGVSSALCAPDSTVVFTAAILHIKTIWKLKWYLVIYAQY